MSTFLEALKAKSEQVKPFQVTPNPLLPEPVKPEPELALSPIKYLVDDYGNPLTVKIERVVNKGRIDVFFNAKPSTKIRELLKQRCFIFNPDTKAWYNKDTELNRTFLKHYLNAGFEVEQTQENTLNADPVKAPILTAIEELPQGVSNDRGTPEFSRYKKQVNALIDTLGIDAADLQLLAIDSLYREKIGNTLV